MIVDKKWFKIGVLCAILISVSALSWWNWKETEPEIKDVMCQISGFDQDNMVVIGKCIFK